jgi:hypothetical protein
MLKQPYRRRFWFALAISKRSLLSAALGILFTVPLGGCFLTFGSNTPLLTGATADFPFRSMVLEGPEGDRVPMVREGDSYVVDDPSEGKAFFLLKKTGDDTYLYQMTEKRARRRGPEIVYGIVKHRQNDLDSLWCGSWSAETLQSVGIEVIKDPLGFPLCDFTSVDQLVSLSTKQPDGKWPGGKLRIVSIER